MNKDDLGSILNDLHYFNEARGFERLYEFDESMEAIRKDYPFIYVAIQDKLRYEEMVDEQTKIIATRISEALDELDWH